MGNVTPWHCAMRKACVALCGMNLWTRSSRNRGHWISFVREENRLPGGRSVTSRAFGENVASMVHKITFLSLKLTCGRVRRSATTLRNTPMDELTASVPSCEFLGMAPRRCCFPCSVETWNSLGNAFWADSVGRGEGRDFRFSRQFPQTG